LLSYVFVVLFSGMKFKFCARGICPARHHQRQLLLHTTNRI